MAAVTVPPELWSKFDDELQTLIEGNHTAEKSYTVGKGMSLASIAVGSVAMRLSKVRAMAQKRDLQSTKVALDKATVKIREAAFTSSGLSGETRAMTKLSHQKLVKQERQQTSGRLAGFIAMELSAPSTSLIGGARRHYGLLQEALSHAQGSPASSPPAVDVRPVMSPVSTTTETATKTSSSSRRGGKRGTPKERKVSSAMDVVEPPEPAASESNPEAPGIDLEVTNTLRKQLRRASADDYWLRLTLAYSLEEQGERWADAGNLSASCSAYSEASELFRTCSEQLPSEPECLLRQWMTARRANEVGYTAVSPDVKVLRRCIEICTGNETTLSEAESIDEVGPGSCNKHPVCYEAHLELVGVLLERGRFERCTQACRHILDEHDEDDAEAMFSMAQALEARGLSEEAQKTASRASFLLSAIP
eukprot:g16797.t2